MVKGCVYDDGETCREKNSGGEDEQRQGSAPVSMIPKPRESVIAPAEEMGHQIEAGNKEVGRKSDTVEDTEGSQAAQDSRRKERGSLLFTLNSCLSTSWALDILYCLECVGP